ncbi:hypothetical protein L1887_60850 [Cichorium endivia]|nr:hypothetical protein L1887_60850 [Cichorium endivia]
MMASGPWRLRLALRCESEPERRDERSAPWRSGSSVGTPHTSWSSSWSGSTRCGSTLARLGAWSGAALARPSKTNWWTPPRTKASFLLDQSGLAAALLGVLGRRGLRYIEERVELGAELVATQREVVLGDGVLGLCDALVGERRRSLTGEERGAKGEDLAVGRDVDVEIAVSDLEAVDELADVVVRDGRSRRRLRGGDRVGVLGARLGVDVVDGGRVGVLASRIDATADGGHVGGRLDVGKHLVGVLGTPCERLAGGILGTRSAGVQESGIGDGCGCEAGKAKPEGEESDESKQALVAVLVGARHGEGGLRRADALCAPGDKLLGLAKIRGSVCRLFGGVSRCGDEKI